MMNIEKKYCEYNKTGYFKGLINFYLEKNSALFPFYNYEFSLQSFSKAINDKAAQQIDRTALREILLSQYAAASLNSEVLFEQYTLPQINALVNKNTYTVTTGHQLCLAGGPLFVVYKILTTIKLADQLKQTYPENNFVPVFWLASEDHDFAEINHFNLFGSKHVWEFPAKGAVGKIQTDTLKPLLLALKEIIGNNENANKLFELFWDAYSNQDNLSHATRFLIHKLFAERGLVVIDGDEKKLKKQFSHHLEQDIFNNVNYRAVKKTITELVETELISSNRIQVNPREINVFYMEKDLRERIIYDNESKFFLVNNTSIKFSFEQLQIQIELYPERFSPNVILRPLYQECILPNLAYIGGPAEISYWLELKHMFEINKVNFPLLMMRNSVLWIDEAISKKIKKLDFDYMDLFLQKDVLEKKYVERFSELNFTDEQENLDAVFQNIISKAKKIDATLVPTVQAEWKKQTQAINSLSKKILKAEKNKFETELAQIFKIKEKLFPNDSMQERYDTFIALYLKHGDDFFEAVYNAFEPFENKFTVIIEHEE
jgi:bacillithiol biosynthesis cysteine-adding enzyme BshC